MDNLMDKERYAKKEAIKRGLLDYLYVLHGFDNPQGYVEQAEEMAEKIMADLEFVSVDFENRYFEARAANAD